MTDIVKKPSDIVIVVNNKGETQLSTQLGDASRVGTPPNRRAAGPMMGMTASILAADGALYWAHGRRTAKSHSRLLTIG